MYELIDAGKASMMELCEYYTLSEALKLYAIMEMKRDIEAIQATEIKAKSQQRH